MERQDGPAVSVIVPIYNTRDYVGACLESLAAQDCDDFEVICVNDGSTDDSEDVARAAIAKDARFTMASQRNGGLSAARNAGLKLARGAYVAFLDSDDLYAPGAIAALTAAAHAADADLVDFSAAMFYDTPEMQGALDEDYTRRDDVDGVHAGSELFARYVETGQLFPSACLHLASRQMILDNGLLFVEGLLHEDEVFTPLLYAHAERAVLVNEPLYLRRVRGESIMTSARTIANIDATFRVTQLLHAWIVENGPRFDERFVDAWALNIAHLHDFNFCGLAEIPDGELERYLDGLEMQDRIAFDLTTRYGPAFAQRRFSEVADSRAFQAAQKTRAALGHLRKRAPFL